MNQSVLQKDTIRTINTVVDHDDTFRADFDDLSQDERKVNHDGQDKSSRFTTQPNKQNDSKVKSKNEVFEDDFEDL